MSSEAITYNLCKVNTALLAAVPLARMFAGEIPLNAVLPAIAFNEVSTVENTTIDANAAYALVTGRVQVTVAAKDYPTVKNIITLIRKACNYQRGEIAGFTVSAIIRDIVGPDFRDSDSGIYYQSIDFKIIYHELN
ncbi:MAG: DUF3168 domain-containing protein [Pseudomonadota bacterium]